MTAKDANLNRRNAAVFPRQRSTGSNLVFQADSRRLGFHLAPDRAHEANEARAQ